MVAQSPKTVQSPPEMHPIANLYDVSSTSVCGCARDCHSFTNPPFSARFHLRFEAFLRDSRSTQAALVGRDAASSCLRDPVESDISVQGWASVYLGAGIATRCTKRAATSGRVTSLRSRFEAAGLVGSPHCARYAAASGSGLRRVYLVVASSQHGAVAGGWARVAHRAACVAQSWAGAAAPL